jgi:hypothetical protein
MIYWINLIDWNGQVKVSRNLWIEEIYFKMHKFIQIFIIINSFKAWYNCWKVLIPKLVLFHIKNIENWIQIWVISLTSYSLLIKLGGKSYSFFFCLVSIHDLFLFYCYYWQNIWILFMFTLSNKRHV